MMITHSEFMILNSTLRPYIVKPDGYYVDPRQWLSWESVIGLLQDSGLLEYKLTDDGKNYGYKVEEFFARRAMHEYRIAGTYKPSKVFESFIENELDVP